MNYLNRIKISVLTLIFGIVLTLSTYASQAYFSVGNYTYYTPTTVSVSYGTYNVISGNYKLPNGEVASPIDNRIYGPNKYTRDGITHYPYEIYLPNEQVPKLYRIHSNYSSNTDACASCHATHTAVGPSLLQWGSTYEACMACHDGTVTTTYNVLYGNIGGYKDAPTYGGQFGLDDDKDVSSHNVRGNINISVAPGGSTAKEEYDPGTGVQTRWKNSFGCGSCHTPHGMGGNARLLSPDPNGWATQKYRKMYTGSELDISSGKLYVTRGSERLYLIDGYPSKIQIFGSDGKTDITSSFSITVNGDINKEGSFTEITKNGSIELNSIGYVYATASFKIRMQIEDYLGPNEKVTHLTGLNEFCGACHVDYNTEDDVKAGNGVSAIMGDETKRPGYGKLTGTYSKAHRHAMGVAFNYGGKADTKYIGPGKIMPTMGDKISCMTCHFAHGTSQRAWKDWLTKDGLLNNFLNGSDQGGLQEQVGSSALKRLPNMATCEACHQKGDDNKGYVYNSIPTTLLNNQIPGTVDPSYDDAAATYVNNDDTCGNCHSKEYQGYYSSTKIMKHSTIRGATFSLFTTEDTKTRCNSVCHVKITCESCHKKASNHIKSPNIKNIYNPAKHTVNEQVNACATCHSNIAQDYASVAHQGISGWNASKHAATGVMSCSTCHDSHKLNIDGASLKEQYNVLCPSCHGQVFNINQTMPYVSGDRYIYFYGGRSSTRSHNQ